VTTDANVSLYASNFLQASYDNTNVLPANTLRSHYLLQTVDGNEWDNEFCVVAIEDSTVVYFNLSAFDIDSVMYRSKSPPYRIVQWSSTTQTHFSLMSAKAAR
jgi:hypothetical protein